MCVTLNSVNQMSAMVTTVPDAWPASIWKLLQHLRVIGACPVQQLVLVAMAMSIVSNAIPAITDIVAN